MHSPAARRIMGAVKFEIACAGEQQRLLAEMAEWYAEEARD